MFSRITNVSNLRLEAGQPPALNGVLFNIAKGLTAPYAPLPDHSWIAQCPHGAIARCWPASFCVKQMQVTQVQVKHTHTVSLTTGPFVRSCLKPLWQLGKHTYFAATTMLRTFYADGMRRRALLELCDSTCPAYHRRCNLFHYFFLA